MKKLFTCKENKQDFSKFFGEIPETRKQRLLEDCRKNDVSIHIDNPSEHSSSGIIDFRGVASEAELEKRLNKKKTLMQSNRANFFSFLALIISIIALIKSFL